MVYWMWLADALGYGSTKTDSVLNAFGSAKNIYLASADDLIKKTSLNKYELKRLSDKSLTKQQKNIELCKSLGINILTYDNVKFPNSLKNIQGPPLCLYYKGELPDFNRLPSISIVGAREAENFSIRAAWSLSARLALANFIIVSGGAMGIDSASHRGCIDVGGKTVAFLACGINFNYLKKNKNLRQSISQNGCLITEFPPEYPLKKNAFHIRNRLISGISLGTVIIEAGKTSGALITAKNAAEQGRDVFVITAKPNNEKYAGSYMLIRDGATPVFNAEDILLEYINSYGNLIDIDKSVNYNLTQLYKSKYSVNKADNEEKNTKEQKNKKIFLQNNKLTLSKNAEIVYNYLNTDFFTIDDVIPTGISVTDIFSSVVELELAGLVKTVPGGRYLKIKQGE